VGRRPALLLGRLAQYVLRTPCWSLSSCSVRPMRNRSWVRILGKDAWLRPSVPHRQGCNPAACGRLKPYPVRRCSITSLENGPPLAWRTHELTRRQTTTLRCDTLLGLVLRPKQPTLSAHGQFGRRGVAAAASRAGRFLGWRPAYLQARRAGVGC
jgi:hypothetical protein